MAVKPKNSDRRSTAGFSVVEMLVITIVIGILVSVAYPRLSVLLPIYRLEGAARGLAIDLQKARSRAISEGRCFQVLIDTTAKTYRVMSKAGASPCGSSGFSADSADPSPRQVASSGAFTVSSSANPVFDPPGTVSTPSAITITNSGGGARTVLVQPTGRIIVQ